MRDARSFGFSHAILQLTMAGSFPRSVGISAEGLLP